MTDFTELRVHGVSGTPPREMLYTDPVSRDREDDYTKVYSVPAMEDGYAPQARAFHWGGLTAGSRWTAFWIFLAPFALANTAGYMTWKRNRTVVFFVRLSGLSLTALFAAQEVTVGAVLYRWVVHQDWPSIGQQWAITAVVAANVLAFVWVGGILSTQSHFATLSWGTRLELLFAPGEDSLRPPTGATNDWSDPAAPGGATTWAADDRLWKAHSILHRIRRIHVATGLALVAIMLGWGAVSNGILLGAGIGVAAAGVILLAVTTMSPEARWVRVATSWLTPLAAILATATVVLTWIESPFPEWTGIHQVTLAISIAFGLAAIGALASGAGKAVGALAIGAFFGSAMGIAAAAVLEQLTRVPGVDQTLGSAPDSVLSNGAGWVAVWMLVMALVLVTVASLLSLWPLADEPGPYPRPGGGAGGQSDRALRGRLEGRKLLVAIRRVTSRIRYLLWAAVMVGLGAAIGLGMFICRGGHCDPSNLMIDDWGPVQWLSWIALAALTVALAVHRGWIAVSIPVAAALITWLPNRDLLKLEIFQVDIDLTNLVHASLAVAVLIPAVFFARSVTAGIGDRESRRRTGILWDVASFWPRHFHPMAPPAYGPNAVQELKAELAGHRGVALSAHSQGSMIALVALTQMSDGEAGQISQVVTYGSPLGLIYRDVFSPVGIDQILGGKAGHPELAWTNLWRKSDYLGGWPINLPDPSNHLADDIGHSHYECTRQYREILAGGPISQPPDETWQCRAPS